MPEGDGWYSEIPVLGVARELLGRAFEDLLDDRLELPPLPDRPRAQPLEHGPRQREAQGDHREFRQAHRARVAIGDRLRDRFGRGRRATGGGLGEGERRLAFVGAGLTAGSGPLTRQSEPCRSLRRCSACR